MNKTIFFGLLLALISMPNAAGQDMSDTPPVLEFPVRKLNFIFVALSQLKKDQPKANLDRMNVAVEEFDDTLEIHFSPDREKVTVKENGDLMVSCGASLGKPFSALYKIKWATLEAVSIGDKINGIGNISDMASSNLLFQKDSKPVVATSVGFSQTVETKDNNLPNISIFPNPVNRGRFQVRTSNMKEKSEYKMILLDVTGKAIMEGKMNLGLKTNTNSFSFPAQHAKGIYFIQITDLFNRTVYSQQLIV